MDGVESGKVKSDGMVDAIGCQRHFIILQQVSQTSRNHKARIELVLREE
eukprot:COSAG02_NODE_295_length_25421_cov_88.063226_12_plen_49_part_00